MGWSPFSILVTKTWKSIICWLKTLTNSIANYYSSKIMWFCEFYVFFISLVQFVKIIWTLGSFLRVFDSCALNVFILYYYSVIHCNGLCIRTYNKHLAGKQCWPCLGWLAMSKSVIYKCWVSFNFKIIVQLQFGINCCAIIIIFL